MTPEEKLIIEASRYIMPAVEDYLGTRCLLLNNIFVGLTLAHESVEKLTKALLILEKVSFPKKCHSIIVLAKLLLEKNLTKYEFLKNSDFIERLDKHYGWRYWDTDPIKRSQTRSPSELCLIDSLWINLYQLYMDFLPTKVKFRNYFHSMLFDGDCEVYTNWSEILFANNGILMEKSKLWKPEYKKIFG